MSKPKGGLGKGLSALIRPVSTPERLSPAPEVPGKGDAIKPGTVTHIEVSRIRPNPFQPRADFDQQALDELKESIRQKGVIQAVTLRHAGDGMYQLISGERRIRACQELGIKTIPAYIRDVRTDEEMLELALIENLQREHLNPIEIAISYQRLMHDVGLTAEDVAKKISKDRTTVVNFLRLLKLPKKIQESLRKGQLTMGHARALVSIPDEKFQLKLFDRILKKDLNVRQVETLVREHSKPFQKQSKSPTRASSSSATDLAERMQQILGTRVKVHLGEDGKGEITVEFYSHDDFGRIFDLISSIRT